MQRGNAVLEFALGFALLWAVFGAVFQFGYTIYVYESLTSAVSNGAAFAARDDFNASSTAAFVSQVQNVVVYGSSGGGGTALAPGLATPMVSVTWTADAAGVPQNVTVSINSYTVPALFKSLTFTSKPSCTVQYIGVFMT